MPDELRFVGTLINTHDDEHAINLLSLNLILCCILFINKVCLSLNILVLVATGSEGN